MAQTIVAVPTDQAAAPRSARNHLWGWLARRLAVGIVILFVVSILVFGVTQALPGDVARIILGKDATDAQVHTLSHQLGLDRPLVVQYWDWLSGMLTGDMGTSLQNGEPVSSIVGPRMFNSFTLGLISMVFIIPISTIVGVYTAYRRDGIIDRAFMAVSTVFNALPVFVVGMLLVASLATSDLHVLPAVSDIPPGTMPWWYPAELVLPVATLTLMGVMYLARLVRASFIDVMSGDYVQMAELKGVSPRRILFRHALPNAIPPSLPAVSLVAANTITGVVVVEYIYAYPGLGTGLINAVGSHDLPVLQACVLIMATAYYVFNFVADLLGYWNSER